MESLPQKQKFQLTELAHSTRIINSDYATWCAKPIPSQEDEE